jgi:hypothetical protein
VLGQFGVACFGACGRAVRQGAGKLDAGEDACRCVHVRVCMYRGDVDVYVDDIQLRAMLCREDGSFHCSLRGVVVDETW